MLEMIEKRIVILDDVRLLPLVKVMKFKVNVKFMDDRICLLSHLSSL